MKTSVRIYTMNYDMSTILIIDRSHKWFLIFHWCYFIFSCFAWFYVVQYFILLNFDKIIKFVLLNKKIKGHTQYK